MDGTRVEPLDNTAVEGLGLLLDWHAEPRPAIKPGPLLQQRADRDGSLGAGARSRKRLRGRAVAVFRVQGHDMDLVAGERGPRRD